MNRYFGTAHGQHRKRKSYTPLWIILGAAAALGLAVMLILIFNPGADTPEDEKGSVSSTLVTPTGTPDPTPSKSSGHPRHHPQL